MATKRTTTEAERVQARYNLLTTGQVAARLSEENVTGDTVKSWIEAGWLRAVDGRKKGANRPYFLIDWSWVETFMTERSTARQAEAV